MKKKNKDMCMIYTYKESIEKNRIRKKRRMKKLVGMINRIEKDAYKTYVCYSYMYKDSMEYKKKFCR